MKTPLISPAWKTKAVHGREFLSTLETPLFTIELMRQDDGGEVPASRRPQSPFDNRS